MVSVEMVPDEIQQEMKNLYCALCELLRHFWACFPTTTKALEDKVFECCLCDDVPLALYAYIGCKPSESLLVQHHLGP